MGDGNSAVTAGLIVRHQLTNKNREDVARQEGSVQRLVKHSYITNHDSGRRNQSWSLK